jgi:hypothetical protein
MKNNSMETARNLYLTADFIGVADVPIDLETNFVWMVKNC